MILLAKKTGAATELFGHGGGNTRHHFIGWLWV
jgi:hypothetical protein